MEEDARHSEGGLGVPGVAVLLGSKHECGDFVGLPQAGGGISGGGGLWGTSRLRKLHP